jgi:hypothetical protein
MIVQHVPEDDISVSKRRHAYSARRFAKRRVLSRLNLGSRISLGSQKLIFAIRQNVSSSRAKYLFLTGIYFDGFL